MARHRSNDNNNTNDTLSYTCIRVVSIGWAVNLLTDNFLTNYCQLQK